MYFWWLIYWLNDSFFYGTCLFVNSLDFILRSTDFLENSLDPNLSNVRSLLFIFPKLFWRLKAKPPEPYDLKFDFLEELSYIGSGGIILDFDFTRLLLSYFLIKFLTSFLLL